MSGPDDRRLIFNRLKQILLPHAGRMAVVTDTEQEFHLDTPHVQPRNRKPLFFGAVRAGKSVTSFHLMPVYTHPELLAGISAGLRRRMQGKSCFNFPRPDETLFRELTTLTQAGVDLYAAEGYLAAGPTELVPLPRQG